MSRIETMFSRTVSSLLVSTTAESIEIMSSQACPLSAQVACQLGPQSMTHPSSTRTSRGTTHQPTLRCASTLTASTIAWMRQHQWSNVEKMCLHPLQRCRGSPRTRPLTTPTSTGVWARMHSNSIRHRWMPEEGEGR